MDSVIHTAEAPRLQIPVPWWVTVVEWAVIVGVVVTVIALIWRCARRRRHAKPLAHEAGMRQWVSQVRARWGWDAQNLGLVLVDQTTRHQVDFFSGRV
ncbi:MAG: hypothetical protein FWD59_09625, partial [Micrococcales bacterium]|nr:hypothetical protein [Micrococcales bacterium]